MRWASKAAELTQGSSADKHFNLRKRRAHLDVEMGAWSRQMDDDRVLLTGRRGLLCSLTTRFGNRALLRGSFGRYASADTHQSEILGFTKLSNNPGATYVPVRFEERLGAFSGVGFADGNLATPFGAVQLGEDLGSISGDELHIAGIVKWPVCESGTGHTHKNCNR